jgi:MoxR-like ATPase
VIADWQVRAPTRYSVAIAGLNRRRRTSNMRFEGTSAYVATDDLKVAVNAAIALERPLLVKGEPGTGKTVLALEIAKSLAAPLIEWHVKSTTKALQGLYEYDAVSRLRDSQLGDARVNDIRNYIRRGKLWEAFVAEERPVLLIDEIDKADIEFPNDLLLELDRMEFYVYETGETIKARRRPIMVVTSNNEKELPDAFLRRCFFHYIRFPDPDTMRAIIEVHFPGIKHRLVAEALKLFYEIRDVPGMKKKPSTSELLDWLKLLMVEDIGPEILRERDPKKLVPPLHGALIKNEQDVHLFERLAFMARRVSEVRITGTSFRVETVGRRPKVENPASSNLRRWLPDSASPPLPNGIDPFTPNRTTHVLLVRCACDTCWRHVGGAWVDKRHAACQD